MTAQKYGFHDFFESAVLSTNSGIGGLPWRQSNSLCGFHWRLRRAGTTQTQACRASADRVDHLKGPQSAVGMFPNGARQQELLLTDFQTGCRHNRPSHFCTCFVLIWVYSPKYDRRPEHHHKA
jgi:hypothetical protein